MEKKLAKPSSDRIEKRVAQALIPATDEMERKRELARKQAQDKVKARTLAKQQQLAERIAVVTEQLASGIEVAEEQSSAAEEVEKSIQMQNRAFNELNAAAADLAQMAEDPVKPPWQKWKKQNGAIAMKNYQVKSTSGLLRILTCQRRIITI